MTNDIDKVSIKRIIISLLKSDDILCAEIFKEIIKHNPKLLKEKEVERSLKIDNIIEEHFEEYDEVFRALAKK